MRPIRIPKNSARHTYRQKHSRISVLYFFKPVSYSPDRFNKLRTLWVFFNLIPQHFDMNRQRLLFAEAVHTPDAGEDIFLAQPLSRIRHKQGKQLEFLSSKLQLVSIQAGSMLITLYQNTGAGTAFLRLQVICPL